MTALVLVDGDTTLLRPSERDLWDLSQVHDRSLLKPLRLASTG